MRDTKPETTYEFLNNQVLVGMDFAEAEASTICVIAANGGDAKLIAHISRLNDHDDIIVHEGQTYITKENLINAMDYLEGHTIRNRRIPMPVYHPPSSIYVDHLDPISMERCIYDVEPGLRGCRGHVSPYDPNPRKARRYGK